ncbi:MAG: PDZ domain-containing protein [Betaproteobacteria bacterium]|nr:PDZ domain-containing protein [Betaproteobacteria bacterium]
MLRFAAAVFFLCALCGPALGAMLSIETLGLALREESQGAVVVGIDLDGPAATAGVQVGDVVAGIDGRGIASLEELGQNLAHRPGPVKLDILRKGERRMIVVVAAPPAPWNALGLQVRELPAVTLRALGIPYGLMVSKVRAPADRTRILPGDVIVSVNQARFASIDEFNRLLASNRAGVVGLVVRRPDSDLYIPIAPLEEQGEASRGGSLPALPHETSRIGQPRGKPLRT